MTTALIPAPAELTPDEARQMLLALFGAAGPRLTAAIIRRFGPEQIRRHLDPDDLARKARAAEKARRRRAENPEKEKRAKKLYRLLYPERCRRSARQSYRANAEERKAAVKKYRDDHKDEINARRRERRRQAKLAARQAEADPAAATTRTPSAPTPKNGHRRRKELLSNQEAAETQCEMTRMPRPKSKPLPKGFVELLLQNEAAEVARLSGLASAEEVRLDELASEPLLNQPLLEEIDLNNPL